MRKVKNTKKQKLKSVGTVTALTATLVISNIPTSAYAVEVREEVNIINNIQDEEVKEEQVLIENEDTSELEVIQNNEQLTSTAVTLDELKTNWTVKEYTSAIVLNAYNGTDTDIVIPGEVEGKRIKINLSCFNNIKSTMTSLKFEETNGTKVQSPGASMSSIFNGCVSLKSIDLSGLDTSGVTNMYNMFNECKSLTSITAGDDLDLSDLENMNAMFRGCSSLQHIDLNNIDMSKVTDMGYAFANCSSLISVNLSGVDLSSLTNMDNIFSGCTSLKDIDLSGVKLPSLSSVENIFNNCDSLENVNLSKADLSGATDISTIFSNSKTLKNIDLSEVNISSKATSLKNMFDGLSVLETVNLSGMNTSNISDMSYMFRNCTSITDLNLSNFNTEKVTDMSYMFDGCSSIKDLDLSNFNTSNVTNMRYMFDKCSSLVNLNLTSFNTTSVKDMANMFKECISLENLDLSNFNTENVTTMTNLFIGCSALKNINFSKDFNTSSVVTMNNMFKDCSSLENLDLSSFDTKSAENMSYMFSNSGVESLDLSSFNTSKVQNMQGMFYNTLDLKNINFGNNFNTSAVTNMSYMFCSSSLEDLDLSKFNTSSANNMVYMFAKLDNIKVLDLSSFNLNNVPDDKIANMFKKNITADSTGKITETDLAAAEKELLVVTTDDKLIKYNYTADACLPVGPTLNANGGVFANGEETNSQFKVHVIKDLSDDSINEVINKALSAEKPTRQGYEFVSWEETQTAWEEFIPAWNEIRTIVIDSNDIFNKLDKTYYAKWNQETIDNTVEDNTPEVNDSLSPETGDTGVLRYIALGLTSISSLFIIKRRRNKK